ncbi:glycosyltransferase family 2 protein [Granulicella arctica]|uniref:Glycosyltransferase involved in cell wall biosynthesis n=1 Tax=Granulicella arctica TaxID=940613 RepID=A0A7Y9PFH5_9BACT|nr:glycosyltransferase family 2 protein [Granulicella arctica]NYF78213.1 glycosyltransferase involved in cell wall biosynthesis [Granulicella arctica]
MALNVGWTLATLVQACMTHMDDEICCTLLERDLFDLLLGTSGIPSSIRSAMISAIILWMALRIEEDKQQRYMPRVVEPLVSIITVVFGAVQDLPELFDSVARFKSNNIEFIVIDGGSKDGTRELLGQYDSVIDYWVSEPDRGIYDAMNKGIAAARGTFLFHLNAGDRLLHLPIQELIVARSNDTDVAAFRVLLDGKREFRPRCGVELRLKNTLHHQGTFYKRAGFPVYNIDYRVFADFDANQRLARDGARIAIFNQVVASHMGGGLSDVQTEATVAEFFEVIRKNYGWIHLPPAWLICKWRGLNTRLSLLLQRLSC